MRISNHDNQFVDILRNFFNLTSKLIKHAIAQLYSQFYSYTRRSLSFSFPLCSVTHIHTHKHTHRHRHTLITMEISIPTGKSPPKYKSPTKTYLLHPLIYIFSYPLFLLLLVTSLLSKIYKLLLTSLLPIKFLPPSDSPWANESLHSPSNIILKFKITSKNANFYAEFYQKFETLLKTHRTLKTLTYEKLTYRITEKYGFYTYTKGELDLTNHIAKLKNVSLKNLTENEINTKLSGNIPQWKIYYVVNNNAENNNVENNNIENYLVLIFHHSYGDGISWVNLVSNLLDETPDYFVNPFLPTQSEKVSWLTRLKTPHYFGTQLKNILTEFNQFHSDLAINTKIITEFKLDLTKIKNYCKVKNIKFTQFIEKCIKNGFISTFNKLPSELLLISPFAKLPYLNYIPRNQFFPCFTLVDFHEEKYEKSDKIKECNLIINNLLGNLPSSVQRLIAHYCARGTLAFSNLPSFKNSKVSICGEIVENFYFTPPIKFRTGISLGLVGFGEDFVYGSLAVDEYLIKRGFNISGFLGSDGGGGGEEIRFLDFFVM